MTHFIVGALVPREIFKKSDEIVRCYIDARMAPYSEGLEVIPYIFKTAKEVGKEFEDYKKEHPKGEKNVREWAKKWYGEELDDKGNLLSTWNKNSFWDWYLVGGRWDGVITDKPQRSDDGANIGEKHETLKNNSIPVGKLLEKARGAQKKIEGYLEVTRSMAKNMESALSNKFACYDLWTKFFGHGDRKEVTKEQQKFYDEVMGRFKENLENYHFYNKYILGKVLDRDGKLHEGRKYGWFGFAKDTKAKTCGSRNTSDFWKTTRTAISWRWTAMCKMKRSDRGDDPEI